VGESEHRRAADQCTIETRIFTSSGNDTVHQPREALNDPLANGVRVITEAMEHVRSVSVGIWVGAGSRRETPEQNGITPFIEHMLFKGNTTR
jgi:hypothetical protein